MIGTAADADVIDGGSKVCDVNTGRDVCTPLRSYDAEIVCACGCSSAGRSQAPMNDEFDEPLLEGGRQTTDGPEADCRSSAEEPLQLETPLAATLSDDVLAVSAISAAARVYKRVAIFKR